MSRFGDDIISVIKNLKRKFASYLRNLEMSTESDFFAEFNDAGDLTICGCCDISLYNEERILIHCRNRSMDISGVNLYVSAFGVDSTIVSGRIVSVDFL